MAYSNASATLVTSEMFLGDGDYLTSDEPLRFPLV